MTNPTSEAGEKRGVEKIAVNQLEASIFDETITKATGLSQDIFDIESIKTVVVVSSYNS